MIDGSRWTQLLSATRNTKHTNHHPDVVRIVTAKRRFTLIAGWATEGKRALVWPENRPLPNAHYQVRAEIDARHAEQIAGCTEPEPKLGRTKTLPITGRCKQGIKPTGRV